MTGGKGRMLVVPFLLSFVVHGIILQQLSHELTILGLVSCQSTVYSLHFTVTVYSARVQPEHVLFHVYT